MLARHRWTEMDEPNSTSRDDWAAALRRAHFLVFFSGAKGLEDAHGRGAGEEFAAGPPSSRELAPTGSQGAKGVLAAVADVQEAVLILVLQVLRYGTERGVGAGRGGVTRATSRYTGLKCGSTPRC